MRKNNSEYGSKRNLTMFDISNIFGDNVTFFY